MTDLQARVLEIEADDDAGRLARALEAAIESCEETIRSVNKNLLPDEHDHASRGHADMVLDAITDALGVDND